MDSVAAVRWDIILHTPNGNIEYYNVNDFMRFDDGTVRFNYNGQYIRYSGVYTKVIAGPLPINPET
jgi:hypothetical protein